MITPFVDNFDIDQVAGFEGPEKRLEIDFKINKNKSEGLRVYDRTSWQELLNLAKCTIISQTSNEHFDSYVLSESSLFVYPFKVVLKTCGTTTLLKTVPKFIEYAEAVDTKPEFLSFTRKNFNFPQKQPHPHTGFDAETEYLNQYFRGESYVLGPVTGDHWHIYIADLSEEQQYSRNPDQTLEIMMSDLDRSAMNHFYRGQLDAKQVTQTTGIDQFLPGSISDEVLFTPCGYSVNGLKEDAYYTIHVTPEPGFSFVSFETNIAMTNYTKLVTQVINVFKPATFCVSVFNDKNSVSGPSRTALSSELEGYELIAPHSASPTFDGDYHVSFWSFKAAQKQD